MPVILFNVWLADRTEEPGAHKAVVEAVPAAYAGFYIAGEIWKPCPDAIEAWLPYRFRKAYNRRRGFWFPNTWTPDTWTPDTLATNTLYGYRGRRLNTIYATAYIHQFSFQENVFVQPNA